jgi:RNA polymerase sigma factor (sigma-70 family)
VVAHFADLEGPTVPRLLGWIRTIVQNRVTEELRRLACRPVRMLGSDVLLLRQPDPDSQSLARAEQVAQVAQALNRLPERQRRVVESRWFDQLPDEQTAAELGITVNHVRQLRFRALQQLRELLGHQKEVMTHES